jgi:hypothetical protein
MSSPYPHLHRTNERKLPPGYEGDVLVWDIDKTYLDTRFSSFRGLLAIPFEFAIDKRALPGTVPLLRALRRGPGERSALVPLYFVSGSPLQMRGVVERKMTLDGVGYDGITFKDQWGLVKSGRPKAIKEQVGYKLTALLHYRLETPATARWLLFGDDVEADSQVFTLFGEVCAGLVGDALRSRLLGHGVGETEMDAALSLAARLEPGPDPVERVFIHLENNTDPAKFTNPKVVPTRSFLQTALVLADLEKIQPRDVRAVAEDLRRGRVAEATLRAQIDDAGSRLGVPEELLELARAK